MARHVVDILIKGRDEVSRQFSKVGQSALSMESILRKAASAIGVYFSARAIMRFVGESIKTWEEQGIAVQHLTSALRTLGPVDDKTKKDMIDFATQMQRSTGIIGHEILEVMVLGATIGKLEDEALKKATIAAIGLSKGFKVDLEMAMRLVSKGAVGISTGLKRLGIDIKDCKTEQELYNKVIEAGERGFRVATEAIEVQIGSTHRLGLAWHEFHEATGEVISSITKPIIGELTTNLEVMAEFLKARADFLNQFVREPNVPDIVKRWDELDLMEESRLKLQEGFAASQEYWAEIWEREKTMTHEMMFEPTPGAEKYVSMWEKITGTIEDAADAVRNFGLTEEEILTKRMLAYGVSTSFAREALAPIRQKEYLEGQQELKDAVLRLRDELATKGMTEWQKAAYGLRQKGVDGYVMGQFENIVEDLKGIEDSIRMQTGGVSPRERQGLTRWPVSGISYEKQTAENTKQHTVLLNQLIELVRKHEPSRTQETLQLAPAGETF